MAGDHKCPVCQATFTRPQHVARHMRSHTGDRPYKCQHCGDQFARSDLLSRHINKCHASEKPPVTTAPNQRRKGGVAACRATTSKQACDQCVTGSMPCDGANPCTKCVGRKQRCTYVKFHRQTAPSGPGHLPPARVPDELPDMLGAYAPRFSAGGPGADELIYPGTDAAALALAGAAATLPQYASAGHYAPPAPPSLAAVQAALGTADSSAHAHTEALDLAARYRSQAEYMRRTGVLPPSTMAQPDAGLGYMPYGAGAGTGGDYRYAGWNDPSASKAADELAQWRASAQAAPSVAYNGYYAPPVAHHARTGSHDAAAAAHAYRRGSLSSSDTASIRSAGYSSSRPTTAETSPVRPPKELESTQASVAGHSHAPGHHDGFSSAFGLLSIEDPAVLAGLQADGTPFFSTLGSALVTPRAEAKPAVFAGRDDGALKSPREAETRELRDFWRQYMHTPLSGGGPLGAAPGYPGAPPPGAGARPGLGKRGLSRVASLPNVKTPAADLGPPQYGYGAQQQQPAQAPPVRTAYIAADDLRRYEAAVLSRKAPMQLNIAPRRTRTGSSAGNAPQDGTYSDSNRGSDESMSVSPPMMARPMGAGSSPPGALVFPPRTMAPPTSVPTASTGAADGAVDARPSFKRLASQTLGPEHAKRPMHMHTYEPADAPDPDAYAYYARGGSESPEPGPADAAARRAERFRRMSAPQPPVGFAPPHGGAHDAAVYA